MLNDLRYEDREDLKSRRISCRLNLAEVNKEREQASFAKVTFGGAGGTVSRTQPTFELKLALAV